MNCGKIIFWEYWSGKNGLGKMSYNLFNILNFDNLQPFADEMRSLSSIYFYHQMASSLYQFPIELIWPDSLFTMSLNNIKETLGNETIFS